jgi:Phosphotransferase enzyme family
MPHPEPVAGCRVSFLVPHPRRLAVLVAVDEDPIATSSTQRHCRLPTIRLSSVDPSLAQILASVEFMDITTTPVLRVVSTTAADVGYGEQGDLTFLVELDAAPAGPPVGWSWEDLDVDVIARLEPEPSRGVVASWARERVEGWSPLRPAWSRPGWFAHAATWMANQMAIDGRPAVGGPAYHHLWGLSVVLRAPSAVGEVFLKCSGEAFRPEGVVTRALAEVTPDVMPEVIAVEEAQGWLLMRDLGGAELGEQDESLWHVGVSTHAGIQQSWLHRTAALIDLGLPVRPLAALAAQIEDMTRDRAVLSRMTSDLRNQWLATAPQLAACSRRLDEIGPGPTLVHGDFHPWNVSFDGARARVFDWTDAAVSHPFVDLATYVYRTQDPATRQQLVDAQVAAWSAVASEETLREAVALGLVVGALYQVQTYRALLPTLIGSGSDDGLAGADLDWINRSLTRYQRGLESPD